MLATLPSPAPQKRASPPSATPARSFPARKGTIFAPVEFVPVGDGLYRAVARKPVELASLTVAANLTGLTREMIYRLYLGEFIEGAQPTPGKIIVSMASLIAHIDASKSEEFWTAERRQRYQVARC